uniref:Ankyrin repeat protein n=1 Tax=viral metagenome TaxID=1070528 RepID=A0A6C0E8V4_9ZZZZ
MIVVYTPRLNTGLNGNNVDRIEYQHINNMVVLWKNCYHFRIILMYNKNNLDVNNYTYDHKSDTFTYRNVIISEKYPLYDINTLKNFKFIITEVYIERLCSMGRIDILEYLKNTHQNLDSKFALFDAAAHGQIGVLEWWKNSGLPLKYSDNATELDVASENNHINVLEWWKNSGLPMTYTNCAVNSASSRGYFYVLNWWKNSGLPLKYNEYAFENAANGGHIDVLDWWKNSGLELKYRPSEICRAIKKNPEVLEWWKNSKLPL